jgi:hypothetical protein
MPNKKQIVKPTLEVCYYDAESKRYRRAYGTDLCIGVTDHKTDPTFVVRMWRGGEKPDYIAATFQLHMLSWCRVYDKKNHESVHGWKQQSYIQRKIECIEDITSGKNINSLLHETKETKS